jgi:hypothetical protein
MLHMPLAQGVGDQLLDALSDQRAGRVAKEHIRLVIALHNASLRVGDDDGIRGHVQNDISCLSE